MYRRSDLVVKGVGSRAGAKHRRYWQPPAVSNASTQVCSGPLPLTEWRQLSSQLLIPKHTVMQSIIVMQSAALEFPFSMHALHGGAGAAE